MIITLYVLMHILTGNCKLKLNKNLKKKVNFINEASKIKKKESINYKYLWWHVLERNETKDKIFFMNFNCKVAFYVMYKLYCNCKYEFD